MINSTRNIVSKYGAKVAAGAALAFPLVSMAQVTDAGAQVVAKVSEGMSQGEQIALTVVLGLFAIFAIKLLWRAK